MSEPTTSHPIDGEALLVAGAKASVPLEHLPELLEAAQAHLRPRTAEYDRRYECLHAADGTRTYFVETGHWLGVGETLGLDAREADAIRRAHAEHVRQLGRRLDRVEEFESALEIREAAVIG